MAIALTVVCATASVCVAQTSRELRPGQQYESGAAVHDAGHAVGFTIPSEWLARIPLESEALLLSSTQHDGVGVIAILDRMTPELLTERLSEPQDFGESVVLQLSRPIERDGARWTAAYLSGNVIGRTVALLGPDEQAVVYFFAGPVHEASAYEAALHELATSTRFDSVTSL
ncbi:MAG: hypothetical protein U0172_10095 [Nitrospiraceae bacterium]